MNPADGEATKIEPRVDGLAGSHDVLQLRATLKNLQPASLLVSLQRIRMVLVIN